MTHLIWKVSALEKKFFFSIFENENFVTPSIRVQINEKILKENIFQTNPFFTYPKTF